MSTNFYICGTRTDVATGQETTYEVEHIGKRSGGWTFLFQGRKQKSLAEWKARLDDLKPGEFIADEYHVTYAPQAFWDEVYETLGDWNGRPTQTQRSGGLPGSDAKHWTEDRFSFSAYEFC